MTDHVYNELIRTYANACLKESVPEEHIDMYVKDAFELFKSLEKGQEEGVEVNIHILNALTYLFTNALRPEQLEAEVLPLYEKYKIKHDVYTYQHLIKMYLNIRDLDTLMALWDRMRAKEDFSPNQRILDNVLEGAIRQKSSDKMVEVLEEYVRL